MTRRILRAFPFALGAAVYGAAFTMMMSGVGIYDSPLVSLAHVIAVLAMAPLACVVATWKGVR